MKPGLLLALTIAAAGGLLALLIVLRPSAGSLEPTDPYEPPVEIFVPEFTLIDTAGAPVTHAALEGEYTLLDFFFTSCPLYCPGMTAQMRRVQTEVASNDLRLMSISIDGERDTQDVVRAYAEGFGADPDRWRFLTGPRASVWPIARGMGFLVGEDPASSIAAPDGSSMAMINHPTRLMLIGPDRRVIGLYRYTEREEVDALIARLNRLLD